MSIIVGIKMMLYNDPKEYHSAIKKKEWNKDIWINMDGSRDCHIEWSEWEIQILFNISYMWNLEM